MRKTITFLLLSGIVLLSACNNSPAETEPDSSNNSLSQTEIFNDDGVSYEADGKENSELIEISILSDKVALMIPKSFEIMSDEMAAIKYPSENRPKVIYTNESGSVNIAFNHTENPFTSSELSDYKDMLTETFENLYPSAEWYTSDIETVNGIDVGVLELITPAVDTEIYNLLWFTNLDERLLLITFNCTIEEIDEWKPIANSIFKSFQIV